jgi:serine/threonine protein kinase
MSANPPGDSRNLYAPTEIVPAPAAPAAPPRAAAPPPRNALPVGTLLGEFELLDVIGVGGFGIVYRAWDRSLKRTVAIKEYLPSSLAMRGEHGQVVVRSAADREPFAAGLESFVKEAQMLAQFDHPSLVKVYRFWEGNGSAYMVMPFYEGRTLREELRRRGAPPDEATLLGWLGPVADALAVVHAERCYHRDIAPDNVLLLEGSDRPLLLDFGAARRVIGDMTQALTAILKPGYAPVEQYGEVPGLKQGPWTDVYALAGVAHFALRGRTPPPSVGRLINDQYEKLAGGPLEGRYSGQLLAAIDHALAVRPESRTATIQQFKAELGLAAPRVSAPAGPAAPAAPAEIDLSLPDDAGFDPTVVDPARHAALQPTERVARDDAYAPTLRVAPPERVLPAGPQTTVYMPPAASAVPPAVGSAPAGARSAPARWIGIGAGAVILVGAAGYFGMRTRTEALPPIAAPKPAIAPAATAPPVAPPAVAAAKPFDIGADFERVVAAQTPGWGLEVKLEKNRLRIGKDRLAFTLRSLQDGQVYVYSHGSDGALQQLYPNALTPPPRVTKGGALRLPQGSLEFNVDGPPGKSRLLVMVSRWPREHQAFAPRVEGGFTTFPTGAEAARLAAANTAPLPLIAGRPECPSGASCNDEFGAATVGYEVVP